MLLVFASIFKILTRLFVILWCDPGGVVLKGLWENKNKTSRMFPVKSN